MIHAFTQQDIAEGKDMQLDRKLYAFFVSKNSNMFDVKEKLKREFGFEANQVKFYFKYQEIKDSSYVLDIPEFDIEEDILLAITLGQPQIELDVILREPLEDIKVAEVRFLNSSDRTEPHKNIHDEFDVDQDKLPWPVYRDWTSELASLSEIIVRNKEYLFSDEQHGFIMDGLTAELHSSHHLAELVEAEAELNRL